MPELTVSCKVDGRATVLTVEGRVEAHDCRIVREALEMARTLRRSGPIAVDLGSAEHLPVAALLMLRRAGDEAIREGRRLTVRKLDPSILSDSRGARLAELLWPADPMLIQRRQPEPGPASKSRLPVPR